MTDANAEQQRAKLREERLTRTIINILIIGVLGLGVLIFISSRRGHKYEGKSVSGLVYSHSQKDCAQVRVTFEKKQAKVFFSAGNFKLRDDFVVPQGGFMTFDLDRQEIEDPNRIRLLDSQHNVFVLLSLDRDRCPEPSE